MNKLNILKKIKKINPKNLINLDIAHKVDTFFSEENFSQDELMQIRNTIYDLHYHGKLYYPLEKNNLSFTGESIYITQDGFLDIKNEPFVSKYITPIWKSYLALSRYMIYKDSKIIKNENEKNIVLIGRWISNILNGLLIILLITVLIVFIFRGIEIDIINFIKDFLNLSSD